jgi:hypothetical protein
MSNKGMAFPDPSVVHCFPSANYREMNELLNTLVSQVIEFVLIVHPDSDDKMHRNILIKS